MSQDAPTPFFVFISYIDPIFEYLKCHPADRRTKQIRRFINRRSITAQQEVCGTVQRRCELFEYIDGRTDAAIAVRDGGLRDTSAAADAGLVEPFELAEALKSRGSEWHGANIEYRKLRYFILTPLT